MLKHGATRHFRKHPHMRGEDLTLDGRHPSATETPPHAWGRPVVSAKRTIRLGNTPTCVGKTLWRNCRGFLGWKHPHMRGEDPRYSFRCGPSKETPPHAWGRPLAENHIHVVHGNTPTCVGKTPVTLLWRRRGGKHPHMRGEDRLQHSTLNSSTETPPHAWGRPKFPSEFILDWGNTPTCVGKTLPNERL